MLTWTELSNEYPPDYEHVLVYCPEPKYGQYNYTIAYFDGVVWICSRTDEIVEPTFWMELTSPDE